jgi:hypothetical protein
MAVGLFVTYGMFGGLSDLFQRATQPRTGPPAATGFEPGRDMDGADPAFRPWPSFSCLANSRSSWSKTSMNPHLKRAVWLFPLYLLLINIFVLPLALGGLLAL